MERRTVFFNADEGANGRRTTVNGGIEIFKYGTGLTNLFIRGPKGGLRHVVVLPDLKLSSWARSSWPFIPKGKYFYLKED